MTVPTKYANHFIPVKYFLASYRALSDGRSGILHLEEQLKSTSILLSDWKVVWTGTCTILRTAVLLFDVDSKSCIEPRIRAEMSREWKIVTSERKDHAIFWEFLRKERNNILKEYKWNAYETWIKPDGTRREDQLSLLTIPTDDAQPVLKMRGGKFDGHDSLDLLRQGADWVEARIFDAIRRAGFDPEEARSIGSFQPLPPIEAGILGSLLTDRSPP